MTMLLASSETENKEKNRACARLVRVDPAEYFAQQFGDYWPEGGEDGDADSNDAGKGLRARPRDAWLRGFAQLRGQMPPAKSVGDCAAIAALTLRAEVEARTLIAGSFSDCGYDAVASRRDVV